ncbi:MAG: SPASM domain-containing protein [Anaerolineae bacterium]|nr:SPASM domain-containing protein [Anaerolineae bacterium]
MNSDVNYEEDHILEGMLAAYKVIEHNLPRRSLLASLADRANLSVPHLRTCSAGQSYLVFDTQGRVAKCQMELDTPVADYRDPDPLSTLRASTQGLVNPQVDEKAECADCEWRYWCGGGCPLQAYRVTGSYNAKSPNCTIYKALYPEVIRLEGLRLLKYADDLD